MRNNYLTGILTTVLGLVLLLNPKFSVEIIVIIMGGYSLFNGIFSLAKIQNLVDDSLYKNAVFIKALSGIIVGSLAIVLPFAFYSAIETVIRIFLYVMGIYLIFSSFTMFFISHKINGASARTRFVRLEALSSLIIGILLLTIPANFGLKIVRIVGIVVALSGVWGVYNTWKNTTIEIEAEKVE